MKNIDKLDKKILSELEENPRVTTKQISKKVHKSQQTVNYRINQLQNKGIINLFSTLINPFSLGYNVHAVFLMFSKLNSETKKELLDYLKKNKHTMHAAIIGGKYDIYFLCTSKDYKELDSILDNLFKNFPRTFYDYQIFPVLHLNYYSYNFIENKKPRKIKTIGIIEEKNLDEIDYKILHEIKQNARKSYLSISEKINVDYHTVKNHIEKMKKQKIIEDYKTFFRIQELGQKAFFVLISLRNYDKKEEKRLINFMSRKSNVTSSIKIIGGIWTYCFKIEIDSYEKLQELITELRNNFPIIDDQEKIPIFSDIEIDHFPASG